MHLDDPARPRSAYGAWPQYVRPSGAAIAPLTGLELAPESGSEGLWALSACWCIAPQAARWFEVRGLSLSRAMEIAARWREDPEKVMREEFGWFWEESAPWARMEPTPVAARDAQEMGL